MTHPGDDDTLTEWFKVTARLHNRIDLAIDARRHRTESAQGRFMNSIRRWHFSIWRHPHHYAASLLAKMVANLATLIWAVVVLSRPNALMPDRVSFYAVMTEYMREDYWAALAVVFSLIGAYRLFSNAPPHWWGAIGYFVIMMFWTSLTAVYIWSATPLRPATTASLAVVAILSVYAFCANPRTHDADAPRIH